MKNRVVKNRVSATAKAVKGSMQKVNIVCDLVRSMRYRPVHDVLLQLRFMRKRAAKDMYLLLKSAVANAENNFGMDIDALHVDEVLVGKSFALKRFHARGRGRASRVQKYYSQVTLYVSEI